MPYKCSVKGCRSNYDSMSEKVSLFQLPTDLEMKAKWLSRIQLNSKVTSFSRVCIKHFKPQDIADSTRRCTLKPCAVPNTLNGDESSETKEDFDICQESLTEDPTEIEDADLIKGFAQFCEGIKGMQVDDWHIYMKADGVCLYRLNSDEDFSEVEMTFKILINKHMRMKLCSKISESDTEELNWILKDCHLQSWSQLIDILAHYQQEPEIISKNQPKKYLRKAYEALLEIRELHEQVELVKAQLISLYDFADTLQDIEEDFYTQPLVEHLDVANETNENLDTVEEFLDDDEQVCYEFEEESKEEEKEAAEEELLEEQNEMEDDDDSPLISLGDSFVCTNCYIRFLSASGLRSHRKTCKIYFSKMQGLIFQTKPLKEEKRLKPEKNMCDICGKQFMTMKGLKEHMKLHNRELRMKCPHCDVVIFAGILQRHIKTVHEKRKPHACSICSKAFATPSLRNDHEKTHSKNIDLQKYLNEVNGSPRYCCPKCSADYETSTLLKKHIEKNCRLAQKKRAYRYPCRDCPKKFSTKTQAAQHRLTVHKVEIKNIEKFCFECDAEFDDYINHIRMHSCNFACSFCGAKFLTEEKLKNHEVTRHATETEEDRPFKCKDKDCGLSFKNANHLRSHCQAIHIPQERDFKCQQCDKKFGLKAHLTVHIRQHNASFPCNFMDCQRTFKKLNNLKEHFERDHGIAEIYLCNIDDCGERFKMLAQLKNHRIFSHGVAFNISKYFEK